jgi:cysteine synthase
VAAFVTGAGSSFVVSCMTVCRRAWIFLGTGGTIAGTGHFLKSMTDNVLVVLADPEGSGLYNKVASSCCFLLVTVAIMNKKCAGKARRHVRPQGERGH